jgi:hypothetical protein
MDRDIATGTEEDADTERAKRGSGITIGIEEYADTEMDTDRGRDSYRHRCRGGHRKGQRQRQG